MYDIDKETIIQMKKLISVLLVAAVIFSVIFSITVEAKGKTTNHLCDSKGFSEDESVYEWHGWIVTNELVTKVYYRLKGDKTTDTTLLDNIVDVEKSANTYTVGVNEIFRDSSLHDAVVQYSLSGGLAEFNAYRIHLYIDLDATEYEEYETDKLVIRGVFADNTDVNLLGETIYPCRKGTVGLTVGNSSTRQKYGYINDVNISAKTETDNSLVAATADTDGNGVLDPYIDIPLPDIDASEYESVSIIYKIVGDVHIGGNIFVRGKDYNTAYSATAGTYFYHDFINDEDWHTAEYVLADVLPAMNNKVLSGIRIPGAGLNSTIYIDSITFNKENNLGFSNVNLSLAPGAVTDINFKFSKIDLAGATNVSVKFSFNGEEKDGVDSSSTSDVTASYKFSGIGPQQMTDTVKATLSATYGETTVSSEKNYSIKQYCLDQLGDNPATNALNTLLVDLLRYGAAAQVYTNYKTDELATKDLTADQLAVGSDTSAALNLTQVDQKITAMTSGEKKVSWTAAGLKLEGDVAIRLKFSAIDNKTISDDLHVKYTINDGVDTYDATITAAANGNYVCYINMPVNMMSATIHATVYESNDAISNTINYSIESYAAAKQDAAEGLGDLVKAMMRFGSAADAYQQSVNN